MPQERNVVSNLTNATFGLWFPLFRWTAGLFPPVWLARLAAATVERVIWKREHVCQAILGNTARVLRLPASSREVEETARAMVSSHSRLWIEFLRYTGRSDLDPRDLVARHDGTDHLLRAHAEGKGAVLLTAHVGNFELGGLFLKDLGLGIDVAVVYAPDPSPVIERHRTEARERIGVDGIPVTRSPLASVSILRALERNTFVAMQGDRDVSGTGRRLPFLGETASFPVGPFKLAAAAGAPLLPVFVLQLPDFRYRTVVEEPIRVDESGGRGGREAALEKAMGKFVALLEQTIRENPSQWYRFTPFWEDGA